MKHKIPPPLIVLACAGLMWLISTYLHIGIFKFARLGFLGIILISCGALISFAGLAAFNRASTTISPLEPEKASSLVTSGIYNFTRNPMYLGMLTILGGLFFLNATLLNLPILAGFVWFITEFQIKPEEDALTKIFGDEFTEYCNRVRRWI